jgi:hypothetical protein
MKKLSILAAAVFGLALSAQAQAPLGLPVTALGYDGTLNHVTARLPLGADNLDVGVNLRLNTAAASGDNTLSFGASAFYVKTLNTWGPVSNNVAGGGWLTLPETGDFGVSLFAGFQPEITLLDRLILSTRFGLRANLLPDFQLYTAGDQISIVQSISFKVRF